MTLDERLAMSRGQCARTGRPLRRCGTRRARTGRPPGAGRGLRKTDELSYNVEHLSSQSLVIDLGNQRGGHRATYNAGKGRKTNEFVRSFVVADQHSVQPLDKALERGMTGQQTNEYRIELKGVRPLAVLDSVIDNTVQQQLAGDVGIILGLCGFQGVVEFGQ